MSEQLAPELRNRSRERSKTPFHLRSQCDGENCNEVGHVHGSSKKSPTVTTITEEPEWLESNNAALIHNKRNLNQASTPSTVPELTTTKVQTKSNQSSQRTTLKAKRILNSGTEVKDNIVNSAHVDLLGTKFSTPERNSLNNSKDLTKMLENVNLNDHLAYKEYKEAGEYWKKYPKTDYVYSSTYSPFRREIKPGVIAMPNMSRRGLDHHLDRIKEMASKNPTHMSATRSRYQSNYNDVDLDEFDYHPTYIHRESEKRPSIFRQFFTAIIMTILSTFNKICCIFTSEENYGNVRRAHLYENKGLSSKTMSTLKSAVLSTFGRIYIIIASIQFWDSCFLQSSNTENHNKKRLLLMLLLLLPLLLLTGLYQYHEKPLPIADISSSSLDYISNYVDLDNVKGITYDQYGNAKNISLDFLLYLKGLSESYAQEIKNVWTEKFST
ncbi:uncharacterized protein LOC119083149 isoform X2 [Bradysia coprophila]|nr:uncharacterized protein LOC119083149 isoform X2 [Bradysia coprophila]XP_037048688.1 uncharacterized protein LOC119083149 isoform X2 [Bradysia coprophila]